MYISDNDKLFCSKIDDIISLSAIRHKPCFTSFLTEKEQHIALEYLKLVCCENYLLYGGYEDSERKILGVFYDEPDAESFPLSAIEFKYRACDKLSHRDFLGSLMGLGIERDTVGDILVSEGRAIVFVKTDIKNYITSQIFKIGRVGVTIKDADLCNLPQGKRKEEKQLTVSSLRLDNIVAAVCNLSRERTSGIILSGNVNVNYDLCQNVSRKMTEGDVFSVRGYGKFILNSINGETKKGRLRVSVIYFR